MIRNAIAGARRRRLERNLGNECKQTKVSIYNVYGSYFKISVPSPRRYAFIFTPMASARTLIEYPE